jgi:hypothetical protein
MADWKRLNLLSGATIDVNMDHVIYMKRTDKNTTSLYFASTEQEATVLEVKETLDEIHGEHNITIHE